MKSTILAILACFAFGTSSAQEINLEKEVYFAGETITLHFSAPSGWPTDAWIGIIPAQVEHGKESINDQHDVAYRYLKGRSSGTLTFKAPSQHGRYDFRMHNTDQNGKEYASLSFTVGNTYQGNASSSLHLNKQHFAPGENIQVNFSALSSYPGDAWVGILPAKVPHGSEAENDKHDLAYQYLKNRSAGVLVFKAPQMPGQYNLRMHNTDNNGKEVCSVDFNVGKANQQAAEAMVSLERDVFSPHESITLNFIAPSSFSSDAWIGIVPSSIPHGSESKNDEHDISYQYLKNRSTGTLLFKAPAQKGSYDFRMHNTDGDGKEVFSITFIVE